nr:YqaJ viral recombinase family protein [uncultured Flavonifractor sp.]
MNQHLVRLNTRSMSRPDWLAQRRKSIGGSDAAGIVGLSQYATPYIVWADKTGRLPDQEDNEAMRQGRDLEAYVAERWMEATGKTVRRSNAMLYSSLYPFAHADIDRTVVGENAGPECKTTSALNLRQFKNVEFPEKYYAQCVHYMAVTGATRWYLAVLVYGRGVFTFTLERDQAEIDALMDAERTFWKLVERGIPLPPWMAWNRPEMPCNAFTLSAGVEISISLDGNICCPDILNFNLRRKKS